MTTHGMSRNEAWVLAHDPVYRKFTDRIIEQVKRDLDHLEEIHVTDGTRHAIVLRDEYGSWEQITLLPSNHYRGLPLEVVAATELDAMLRVADREGWIG